MNRYIKTAAVALAAWAALEYVDHYLAINDGIPGTPFDRWMTYEAGMVVLLAYCFS